MRTALPNREICPHSTRRAFVKSATRTSSAGAGVAFAAMRRSFKTWCSRSAGTVRTRDDWPNSLLST